LGAGSTGAPQEGQEKVSLGIEFLELNEFLILFVTHEAFLFQAGFAKIEQDSEFKTGDGEVIDCLGLVSVIQGRDGFDLQDNFTVNHKIGNVITNQQAFVDDRQTDLFFERNISQGEFVRQRF
jgi:hypothetical protein